MCMYVHGFFSPFTLVRNEPDPEIMFFLPQGRILLGDPGVALKKRNILASNGIIHTLDGIFIPPSIIPILPHRCNEQQYKTVAVSPVYLVPLHLLVSFSPAL